jgi:shikimate kinase
LKNIFLIGMPSSGKSTLGRRLADALHYRFVDTDRLIVRAEGLTINAIFAQHGEGYFRDCEARTLRDIRPGASLVVSTGGGMPCFNDNMAYLNATGISIFLDVPPALLLRRMRAHAVLDRPLYDPANPDLLATLQAKYEARLPFYAQANIIVSGETTHHDLLKEVGAWL